MSSFNPSESTVGQNIDRGMDLFRRAHVGDAAAVAGTTPRRVLLVLDGSGQDKCSVPLAAHLKARFGCELFVADARETDPAAEKCEAVAADLAARPLARTPGESFEQILAAVESSGCDLALTPCPFGREPESVGPHSAGLTTDMLLARSPVPLLVIRWPFPVDLPDDGVVGGWDASAANPFAKIVITVVGENDAARPAAGWACGLVTERGGVALELILEDEFYENVRAAAARTGPGRRHLARAAHAGLAQRVR